MAGRRAEMELRGSVSCEKWEVLLRGIDTGGFVKGHGVQVGCNTTVKRAVG